MTSDAAPRMLIRKKIRRLRNQLSLQQQRSAALAVCERLCQHANIASAQHIAVFLSFDGELDTRPLIEALWEKQKSVYVPVLHPFSRDHLLFLHYTANTAMEKHTFGFHQPKLDVQSVLPTSALDIIVTPLVAFDKQGNRLGMGRGYYDRTLKHWQKNQTYPIGIAHDCQQVEQLPCEEWDIPLPEVITPSRHWVW